MLPAPEPPNREARLQARQRPEGTPAMFQSWQKLLFLHWTVAAEELEYRLPPGLHLDTFEDQAWLGIVPFLMRKVRPRGLPAVPGISNFLELNVRTYVFDDSGVPGVWFFSLDASSRLACAVARARFHLPYREARMKASGHEWTDYSAQRRGEAEAARYRYRGTGAESVAEPSSLEFFLLERYVLYAFQKEKSRLWRGRVHHQPYQFRLAEVDACSTAPLAWDGLSLPSREPDHACVAEGVDVSVFGLREVPIDER